jgi:hypothetical protein
MPDVLQKIIEANPIRNGRAMVSIQPVVVINNRTLPSKINSTYEMLYNSGVLDDRLDEIRYYTSSG